MTGLLLGDNEFYAIKVSQPFQEFYTVKLKASYLLERAYSKAADFDGSSISGGQRKITNRRLEQISDYIDSGDATFPNSIIVAANYDANDIFVDDERRWRIEPIEGCSDLYKLIIPTNSKICSVVDGQHRLFAFSKAQIKDMELNCSVYLDLIPSLQASVFATVNFNQAPVDKSVAYNLFGYQLDSLEPKDWSPDLLAVNLCRFFSETENSFFYKHINYRLLTRNVPKGYWVISTASFVDGVLSLISKEPKDDRYRINKKEILSLAGRKALKEDKNFPLRNLYIEGNDEAIKQIIESFFESLKNVFTLAHSDNSVLTKTIGIKALFLLLGEILKAQTEINKNVLESFSSLLSKAKNVPFADTEFFPSSTKGQTRLLNILKNKVLDIDFAVLFEKENGETPQEYLDFLEKMND